MFAIRIFQSTKTLSPKAEFEKMHFPIVKKDDAKLFEMKIVSSPKQKLFMLLSKGKIVMSTVYRH